MYKVPVRRGTNILTGGDRGVMGDLGFTLSHEGQTGWYSDR